MEVAVFTLTDYINSTFRRYGIFTKLLNHSVRKKFKIL